METDWNDLKILAALARGGSISAAARELKVDASTVSRRLTAIEKSLGAMLLSRSGKEFAWTTEGQSALRYARAVEQLVIEAERTIRAAKVDIAGIVRVSSPSGVAIALTRILPGIRKIHPLLAVEISADNDAVDLSKGEADIAVRMFKPVESGLVFRRAFEVGWGVFASKPYAAKHGLPASIDELPDHQLVLYVEAMHGATGLRWMDDHRGTATGLMRVDNTEVAAKAISSGAGIGVVPCHIAAVHPELIRVFPEPVAFSTGWIVYHEAARNTARVRVVVDLLVEYFDANMQLFSGRVALGKNPV